MVSTFSSYRLYTADLAKSLKRTLADGQVSREQEYYKQNIGKVKSVDDFLKDQRLYTYAMKAHGLEDMTYAKAFMRKVLESDVTDSSSFVRKLVDKRYLAFAQSYNFNSEGGITSGEAVAQDQLDIDETAGLYSERRVRQGAAVATEVEYYKARIGQITSADDLVSDPRLFNFALTTYGIDASIASESAIKSVLSGDFSVVASSPNLAKYQALSAAYSFQSDGSVADGGQAQSSAQVAITINRHYEATNTDESPAAAAFKTDVYKNALSGITSVDDFVANGIVKDYALVAAGIDPLTMSSAMVRDILTSDLSDPSSYANTNSKYAKLAEMFNFNSDGSLSDGTPAQTDTQRDALIDGFFANYQSGAKSDDAAATKDYKFVIGLLKSAGDLVKDARAFKYVLNAFGLDPATESPDKIKRVLTSDLSNSTSYAYMLRDERYVKLAQAFNFGTDGSAQGERNAQYASSKADTIQRYTATVGTYDFQKTAGEAESKYYSSFVDTVESVDQLLSDKRAVAYIKKAYGFDKETISDAVLRRVLTSDVNDPTSYVNQGTNTRFRDLASAFNFDKNGDAKRMTLGLAQDPNEVSETQDLYVRQTMEERAGDQNEGVRLALYFQRKASSITSAYSILADKALLEVAMTSLGIPDSAAQADVDTLAKMISSRIDIADFKDPAKTDKFLARFASLYDLQNTDSSSNIATMLLSGSTSTGFSESLLSSIQTMNMKF